MAGEAEESMRLDGRRMGAGIALAGWGTGICGLLAPQAVPAADVALGRYLAAECVACHPRDSRVSGIPAIVGWPQEQFVAVLRSYKAKERANPVMQNVAAGLTEEQMAALAAYFATQKPGG
jgi:cytochrome c553